MKQKQASITEKEDQRSEGEEMDRETKKKEKGSRHNEKQKCRGREFSGVLENHVG